MKTTTDGRMTARKTRLRSSIMAMTALCTGSFAPPFAYGQTITQPAPVTAPLTTDASQGSPNTPSPGKPATAGQPGSTAAGGNAAENVIVVGSRVRPLQHESLPATVFDAKEIERAGISSPADIFNLTPGISLVEGNEPADSQVSIRGISQTYSPVADAPIAVIVDGVPLTSPTDFNQELYDLSLIEVIKGPQNAIYGRNAVAGAIVINTQLPPDKLQYSFTGTATNGTGLDALIKVGGPLVDNLVTGSLVFSETHFGGLQTDITTGEKIDYQDNQGARGRLYITPNEDLSIDLKTGWTQMSGAGLTYRAQIAGSPYYHGPVPDVNNSSEPYVATLPNLVLTQKLNESMRIDWTIPFGKVSSVTSYNFNKDEDGAALFPYFPSVQGSAGGTQAARYANNSFFQELKYITNTFYGFRFQGGADFTYFTRRDVTSSGYTLNNTQLYGLGPFPVNSANPTTAFADDLFRTKSWELFGEATYDITSNLSADAALRYIANNITDENKAPPDFVANPGQVRDAAFFKAEPRIALTYRLNKDVNVYADWALGSLPGGFNPSGSSVAIKKIIPDAIVSDTFKQESSRNWEIGFNSQLFDHRLTLNGAAYYNVMSNQQYDLYYPTAGLEVLNTIDKVDNYGGELQAIVIPAPGWRVDSSLGLLHSEIKAFAADTTAVGNRTPYTPEFNFAFALERDMKLTETLSGFARFQDTVKGTEYWEADNLPGGRSNIVNLASVRVGVRGKYWGLTGYVTNLGDNRYNSSNVVLTQGVVATYLAEPRVYGIQLTLNN
jgi:iron complex outermembrane receptor protein